MSAVVIKPPRLLARRANFHLTTVRMLIDLALEFEKYGGMPPIVVDYLKAAREETVEALALMTEATQVPSRRGAARE